MKISLGGGGGVQKFPETLFTRYGWVDQPLAHEANFWQAAHHIWASSDAILIFSPKQCKQGLKRKLYNYFSNWTKNEPVAGRIVYAHIWHAI